MSAPCLFFVMHGQRQIVVQAFRLLAITFAMQIL